MYFDAGVVKADFWCWVPLQERCFSCRRRFASADPQVNKALVIPQLHCDVTGTGATCVSLQPGEHWSKAGENTTGMAQGLESCL